MTSANRTPRLADWLVRLFVSKDQIPLILGDLREEFSTLTSSRGLRSARFWYWRQVAKTIPNLLYAELLLGPWQVLLGVVAGLFLLWLGNIPLAAIWDRYPAHWPEPLRLLWLVCFPIAALIIPPMLSGCTVGWLSRRRGMILIVLLSFAVLAARIVSHSLYPGHVPMGGPPFWSILWWERDPFHPTVIPLNIVVWPAATFVGGAIARKVPFELGSTASVKAT